MSEKAPIPPVDAPPVRLAFTDEYGPVWTDSRGYLYRGEYFRAEYEALKEALEANGQAVPDWTDRGTFFRTMVPVPAYRNVFEQLSEYVVTGIDPVIETFDKKVKPSTGTTVALLFGGILIVAGIVAYKAPKARNR